MIDPIIRNNTFNSNNFWIFIKSETKFIFKCIVFFIFLYIVYFNIKSPKYSSHVSFYTNFSQVENISSLSPLLSSFGGLPDSNDLKFSIKNYVSSEKFLNDIALNLYSIDSSDESKTLVDLWGQDYKKIFSLNPIELISRIDHRFKLKNDLSDQDRKISFVKEKLKLAIKYDEDRKSSLHRIKITVRNNASLSREIAENAYSSIIKYSNEINSVKALEKRIFIEERIVDIDRLLKDSENRMLRFNQENIKSNVSPALQLEKSRIQRDITLYNQLFISLSDQLELAKIDEKDITSSIFLLDEAQINPLKEGFTFFEGLIIIIFISISFAISYLIFLNKDSLIIFSDDKVQNS